MITARILLTVPVVVGTYEELVARCVELRLLCEEGNGVVSSSIEIDRPVDLTNQALV